MKGSEPIEVKVPFKADFITINSAVLDAVNCGGGTDEDGIYKIVASGPGTATHLGSITFYSAFCWKYPGEYWEAKDGIGFLTAANGDKLFYTAPPAVIVPPDENDPPYYIAKFDSPFQFAGGTGRFEGASGVGQLHGYNTNIPGEENMTHHLWVGILTMVKGNQ